MTANATRRTCGAIQRYVKSRECAVILMPANYTASHIWPQPRRQHCASPPPGSSSGYPRYFPVLQPTPPGGQVGMGFPSACSRGGLENVLNNTMEVARNQNSFFTMHLLCEGFAP